VADPARPRSRHNRRKSSPLTETPFRLLRNPYPPFGVLSPEQLEQIHQASLDILKTIGIEFLDEETLEVWAEAGAQVERSTGRVRLDPGLVMAAIAQAPAHFTLRARNPAHNLVIGGNFISMAPGAGCPYVSDFKRGRRPGTLAAYQEIVRLVQQCPPLHLVGGVMVEPQDVAVPIRHLEQLYSQFTLSDKAVITPARGREVATDCIHMARLVFGNTTEAVQLGIINANSPLRYDAQMLGGLITYARAGQPIIITPFILAGAMSPITLAAALAQHNAEALAGVALTQLVKPGVPVIYGGFTTNIDMQTGGPAFGGPEGALAMFAGAQLARYYGLPYRGSGSLNNAKTPDAQAGYETQMTLWPAVLAQANVIHHSAGWLEAGLVFSYEKFMLDVEGLRMMARLLDGIEVNAETLALDSLAEVGPGGHHFGTAHTMARFRSEFYLPILSDRQHYDAWVEQGSLDAGQRAYQLWQELLANYEAPPLDPALAEALHMYVARRKSELAGPIRAT
jgi:trimethylamine--corrinoid protein Co-methyltransferase